MSSRPLRFYEFICSSMNINFMLDIECEELNSDHVKNAFKLLKKLHPYYRMRLVPNGTGLDYLENSQVELNDVYLDLFESSSLEELNELWQSRLIAIGSKPRDLSQSLIFFELYSFKNRHQLFTSINHSGIDGPGVFVTVRDFCRFLDLTLEGKADEQKVESLPFLDIHKNYEHSFDLNELHKQSRITNFLEPVQTKINLDETKECALVESEFVQLDEQTTCCLIKNCKTNNCTIQGVLSTALILSLINDRKKSLDTRIKAVNSCPCNMRAYLNISSDNLVCGSTALIWEHEIDPKDSLWDLAAQTTAHIKQKLSENYGFKWWVELASSVAPQSFSIMSSSMGLVSLNETSVRNFKINDLRFLGSAYQSSVKSVSIMTHAFTFKDRFTFNCSYTYPSLSKEWAKCFTLNVRKILEFFASNESTTQNVKEFLPSLMDTSIIA